MEPKEAGSGGLSKALAKGKVLAKGKEVVKGKAMLELVKGKERVEETSMLELAKGKVQMLCCQTLLQRESVHKFQRGTPLLPRNQKQCQMSLKLLKLLAQGT